MRSLASSVQPVRLDCPARALNASKTPSVCRFRREKVAQALPKCGDEALLDAAWMWAIVGPILSCSPLFNRPDSRTPSGDSNGRSKR